MINATEKRRRKIAVHMETGTRGVQGCKGKKWRKMAWDGTHITIMDYILYGLAIVLLSESSHRRHNGRDGLHGYTQY